MDWTGERQEKLKAFLVEKRPTKEIAAYFGVDEFAIRQKLYRMGIKRGNIGQHSSKLEEKKMPRLNADLATRIRILRGEEVRKDAPHFGFSDDQLRQWLESSEGCQRFCKEVLGIELQSYQLEAVENILKHKRNCLLWGRQTGKDFTIACAVVWLCITRPDFKVLLVSPAQRQSDLLYNQILEFIGANNELFTSVERSNMELCRFTNGSTIKSLPSTTYIRGETGVHLCVLNEARDFSDGEAVLSSVMPMLATVNGSLLMASSPGACHGILWEAFNNPVYHHTQLPTSTNKFIQEGFLEQQKQELPSNIYLVEYEAQFSEAVDNFFSADLVNKCTQKYDPTSGREPGKTYYLGVDWGRVRDSSVFTVLSVDSSGLKKVEKIVELIGTPFAQQLGHIKLLHQTYEFSRITVEKAGLSLPLCEQLLKEGLPISEFVPTIDTKAKAFNDLHKLMEEGRLVIPNHPKLQFQLRTFRYEVTETGKMKLHHATAESGDDFVDSLCFAAISRPKPVYHIAFGPRRR